MTLFKTFGFPKSLILPLLLLGTLSLTLPTACKWLGKKDTPEANDLTKNNKPGTAMPALPTNGDYQETWAVIDSLEREGLYKSALEQTEALYARVKKDNNVGQSIKALIYKGKYAVLLGEDGVVNAISTFEEAEKSAKMPEKAVIHSLLGQLYSIYVEDQGWNLFDRTPIPDGEGGDIKTWSAAQIEKKSLDWYLSSVQSPTLREVPLDYIKDITTPGKNDTIGLPLRPSLYDFLAHRALIHFASGRSFMTEPVYKFEVNQEAAFAPVETFVKIPLETRDSSSGQWRALRLFQEILAWRLSKKDQVAALIDLDLLRLEFVRNQSVLVNKEVLYEKALINLHDTYKNLPSDAEIVLKLAQMWYNQEQPENTSQDNPRKRALEWCRQAISAHPGTLGAKACQAMVQEIEKVSLMGQEMEETILPNQPSLVKIEYQNLSKVYYKMVRVNFDQDKWAYISWDERVKYINGLGIVFQSAESITDPGDYYKHSTEISIAPVPVGSYMLAISENPDFDTKKGTVGLMFVQCTQLAFTSFQENATLTYIVVDRETGAPKPNVRADFFYKKYDSAASDYKRVSRGFEISDKNGMVRRKAIDRESGEVFFTQGPDSLFSGSYYSYVNQDERSYQQVQFFTDRVLYRPGQSVYFKGIFFSTNEKRIPAILPNRSVTARFMDVNGQEKGMLKLKTNDYGAFNGVFTAPSSGLTGSMSIRIDDASGSADIQVEEYKRPKFEVLIKPVEGAYRVNDQVKVHGEAKSFAGSNIDGASVRYRVVRNARFPFWEYNWWKRTVPRYSESMEITSGNMSTGADGGFDISFEAVPDQKIPKKEQPFFDYTVYVDVTDINGETRSAQYNVTAGYIALQVDLQLPETIDLEELKAVSLKTTNLNGQAQSTSGDITFQRIIPPAQPFKNRYWPKPDVWSIDEAAFKRDFPEYAWKEEDNPETWPKESGTIRFPFKTGTKEDKFNLNDGKIKAGYYAIQLKTQDAFGEPIEIKRIVKVWDKKNPASRFDLPEIVVDKPSVEPGENATFWLGGKAPQLNMFFAGEKEGDFENARWLNVQGSTEVTIAATEEDRGGMYAYWFCVYHNRIYANTPISIAVPWSNKELKITYESFRDKLAPGQQEEWRLKISGPKKDKVAAELVASLYDASLDQFLAHGWTPIGYPSKYSRIRANMNQLFGITTAGLYQEYSQPEAADFYREYPQLNWFGFPNDRFDTVVTFDPETYEERVQVVRESNKMLKAMPSAAPMEDRMEEMAGGVLTSQEISRPVATAPAPSPIRTNLNETVFFYPELRTDADGNVILKFKMNEALTRWKLLLYAHTTDLKEAVSSKEVVTQKDLMVLANPPRFFRAGDQFEFAAKVSNLTAEKLDGTATLSLLDAATLQPLEKQFGLLQKSISFSAPANQSAALKWAIQIPGDFTGAVTWQVFADGKKVRDGEESTVPVVTNRMLVTETMPITVRGNQQKSFVFDNLKNLTSTSLKSHRYTLEFTSNPAWYVVQALPYLMEYPYECSEQIFSRYYANTLASSVTAKMPAIRRVYDRWKETGALKSNLAKNQELKYALLEETPWVLDAQNEAQQKQQIALLFDLNRMADEQQRALNTLAERQTGAGAWPWFAGGPESWHITQYIAEGLGHLQHLNAIQLEQDGPLREMLDKALGFCDRQVLKHYQDIERLVKEGKTTWEADHLDPEIIHYLYTRSFFPFDKIDKISAYYLEQAQKYWIGKGLYQEGLLALALHRNGRTDAANRIVNSLRERAIQKEELGMYWAFDWGYFWYQMPVETQALMVEVFDEVAKDTKAVEELRIWLLKNKQTNRWESTKATAQAVYALLLHGDNWLNNDQQVSVSAGGQKIKVDEIEPGTGYFKQVWTEKAVKPSLGNISINNPNKNIAWGAAYWQYFEDLDKIKSFKKTPLTIVKQLFKEENSPTGPKLVPIADGAALKVGDQLKVRIEIRVDRPMEYVHLKDMRAAGFEPRNVLSGYRYQNGLGYYENTKDLATNFFIDYLPKGTFVFEYPLVVSHRGNMSNGITTMQCMYAPEFTSHSQGIRVKVD